VDGLDRRPWGAILEVHRRRDPQEGRRCSVPCVRIASEPFSSATATTRVRQLSRAEAETILGKLELGRAGRLRVRATLIRFVADEKARRVEGLCCKPQAQPFQMPFRCHGTLPEALIPRPLASKAKLPGQAKSALATDPCLRSMANLSECSGTLYLAAVPCRFVIFKRQRPLRRAHASLPHHLRYGDDPRQRL
jgi:hypothetical protein